MGAALPKAVAKAACAETALPKAAAKATPAPKVAAQVSKPDTPSWAARAPPMVAAAQWPGAWSEGQEACKWCAVGECWTHAPKGGKGSAVASWKGGSAAIWPWAYGGP